MSNPYQPPNVSNASTEEVVLREPFPFASVGPLTGATVGASIAVSQHFVWWVYGSPDFGIRPGTELLSVIVLAIGGMIFGCFYALPVAWVLRFRGYMQVRRNLHIWAANLLAIAVGSITSVVAFELRNAQYVWWSIPIVVVLSFAVAVTTAKVPTYYIN